MNKRLLFLLIGFVCLVKFCSCSEDGSLVDNKPYVNNVVSNRNEEILNVFCSADDGNAKQTAVAIASLLSNTPKDREVSLYIVYFENKPMSQENKNKIESLKKIKDYNLNFVAFNIEKLDQFQNDSWHKAILVKLFASEIFKDLSKIMWIDDDIVINKNITEVYDRDIKEKYVAAVDVSRHYTLYHPERKSVFWINCGMNIYNLEEMRKDKIQEKLLIKAKEYTKEFSKSEENQGGVEEFALTYAIDKSKFLLLPYRYCILPFFDIIDEGRRHFENEKKEIENGVIFHYCGLWKPWLDNRGKLKPHYLRIWDKYYRMTPYCEHILREAA